MTDVTMPNGDVVSFPDDMPDEEIRSLIATKFPEEIAALGQEPMPAPAPEGKSIAGDIIAFQKGLSDTATWGFGDEMKAYMQAGIRSGLDPNVAFDQAYNHFLNKARAGAAEAQAESPYMYGAGQITGAVAAPAAATPKAISKGVAHAAQKGFVPKLAAYTGLGAVSGGLYGLGTGETTEERAGKALEYGGYGGFGGLVAPAAASLAGRAKALFSKKASTAAKLAAPQTKEAAQEVIETIAEQSDELAPVTGAGKAFAKVEKQLRSDLGDNYDAVLDAYKKGDISLAELNQSRTRTLAIGAAQYAGGKARAQQFFDPKIAGSYDRVIANIGKNITDVENYHTTADDLLKAGRAKAAPIYAEAYEAAFKPSDKITEFLNRPSGKAALIKAKKIAADEGVDLDNEAPFVLYDYIKRGFDDVLDGYRDKTTGKLVLDTRGRAIEGLRSDYVKELKSLNPKYAEALKESGDYLSINGAMEKGRKALKTDAEILKRQIKEMSEPEKRAYQLGLGKAIRDEVGRVAEGANPYRRILGSPEKQRRISAVLSPRQYKALERGLKAEDRLFKMRNEILGGSPTIGKGEAKGMIESGISAVDNVSQVPRKTMIAGLRKFYDGMNDEVASKVSEILYETDPAKKLLIINKLSKSATMTKAEKQLVKKAYFEQMDQFDVLKAPLAIAGGHGVPEVIDTVKGQEND